MKIYLLEVFNLALDDYVVKGIFESKVKALRYSENIKDAFYDNKKISVTEYNLNEKDDEK